MAKKKAKSTANKRKGHRGAKKKVAFTATATESTTQQRTKKRVDFTATTKGTVAAYVVDAAMVQVLPGPGAVDVDTGVKQPLVWQFAGMPGDSLSITGKVGQQTVVEVTDSTVPPGSNHGGGFKHFTVT
jgi:hypothetical protein